MHWYVVNTQVRKEHVALMSLRRLGVEVFSPQLKKNRVIRGKRHISVNSLFPGYCFVRFNLDTHYRAVHYAQCVRGVVAFGAVPAEVDEKIILSIKSRVKDGFIIMKTPGFEPGQTVKIQRGPFEGLQAIFKQEMAAEKRVVLLLKTLKYQAFVKVDREQIEIVSN